MNSRENQQLFILLRNMIGLAANFVLLLFYSTAGFDSCSFRSLQEAVQESSISYQMVEISLAQFTTFKDSYGFGFWSQHLPYYEITAPTLIGNALNKDLVTVGRLFFLIKYKLTQENFLIYSQKLPITFPNLQHSLYFLQDNLIEEKQINLDTYYYEGQWILTYFWFNRADSRLVVQVAGEYQPLVELEVTQFNIPQDAIFLTLGGYGQVELGSQSRQFTFFSGRLSKLIIQKDSPYLSTKEILLNSMQSNSCSVPVECTSAQTQELLSYMLFDGNDKFSTSFYQTGKNYIISLWSKPNFSKFKVGLWMFLLRVTINKNYSDTSKLGDRSFHIKYHINFLQKWSFLGTSVYHFKIPEKEGEGVTNHEVLFGNPEWTHEALQGWHYIAYYQNVDITLLGPKYRQFFTVRFPMHQLFGLCNFGEINANDQFSNTNMYVYIGTDNYFFQEKFLGQIAMFTVRTCNPPDAYRDPECHYACSPIKCLGPNSNDCFQCEPEHNRVLIKEYTTCECLKGFIEVLNDPVCRRFEERYPTIAITEEQVQEAYFIRQGKYYIDQVEYDCPQSVQGNLFCLECLRQPLTWYLQPICQSDYKRSSSELHSPFYRTERISENFDLYIVNSDFKIELCAGCQEFCEEGDDMCHLTNYVHLGQRAWIKCKQSTSFIGGLCQKCDENCLKCHSSQVCQECNQGFYLNEVELRCQMCPSQCESCIYNAQTKQPECASCPKQYSLQNGQCWKCGVYCEFCEFQFDKTSSNNINRCYRCIDQSKYFVSFDGVNCLPNLIDKCLYAFQYNLNDRHQTTLDFEFSPQTLANNIVTACAQCNLGLVYTRSENTCTDYYEGQVMGEYFYRENTSELPVCISCFNSKYAQQMIGNCFQNKFKIENCRQCLFSNTFKIWKCSGCLSGYYSSRFNGICIPCPLNCLVCSQQMKKSKDSYIWGVKPFYEFFSNFDGTHDFEFYGQSQNIEDYELICSICPNDLELYDGKCIEPCSRYCKKCVKQNGQNVCQQCYNSQQGQMLAIHSSQCILCPDNCALCQVLNEQEVRRINPFFSNKNLQYFSNYCLQSFDQEKEKSPLYYDAQIGKMIACKQHLACEFKLQIRKEIYCNEQEYDQKLAQLTSEREREIFQQRSSKFIDIFSRIQSIRFKEFHNEIFYRELNQRQVKAVILILDFKSQQQCTLNHPGLVNQQFSENIFSAIDVHLHLQGSGSKIFFSSNLTLANFTYIEFKDLNFLSTPSEHENVLIIESLIPTNISFNNCIFNQQFKEKNFYFKFQKLDTLVMQNVKFIHLYLSQIRGFFQFDESSPLSALSSSVQRKPLNLSGLSLIDSKLQDSTLFLIEYTATYVKQLDIKNCTIIRSSIFLVQEQYLSLQDLSITSLALKQSQVIISKSQHTLDISKVLVQDTFFDQSNFLHFNNIIKVQKMSFSNIDLISNSVLVFQSLETGSVNQQDFYLSAVSFANVSYSQGSQLASFNYGEITIEFLSMEKLIFKDILTSSYRPKMIDSLISLNMTKVRIDHAVVRKSFGFPEIALMSTLVVSINDFAIIQQQEFELKGLHQYLDCILRIPTLRYLVTSLYIFEFQSVKITDLKIQNLLVVDYQLITITQNIVNYPKFDIQISNVIISENLLVLTSEKFSIGIIYLSSELYGSTSIENFNINSNHMNSYVQDTSMDSVGLLQIKTNRAALLMNNINVEKNIVTNTTNNLIQIHVFELLFKNSFFNQNNILISAIITKNLAWSQNQNLFIYQEQLNKVFPIFSQSGCCQFTLSHLYMENVTIINQQGSKGSCINLNLFSNPIINVTKSQFVNINSISEIHGYGGCFYISNEAAKAVVAFENVAFENISTKTAGGILYLQPNIFQIDLFFKNSNFTNIEAITGTLVHLDKQSDVSSTQLVMSDIIISNTKSGFFQFLSYFEELDKNLLAELIENRQMFYFRFVDATFQNFHINNLFHQKLLYGIDTTLKMKSIVISDGILEGYLIFLESKLNMQTQLVTEEMLIQNITIGSQSENKIMCREYERANLTIAMQCSDQQTTRVIDSIKFKNSAYYENIGNCNFLQFEDEIKQSIQLIGLIYVSNTNTSLISLKKLIFLFINCENCTNGLLSLQTNQNQLHGSLSNVNVMNNTCGKKGCINLMSSQKRALQSIDQSIIELQVPYSIRRMSCLSNHASHGGCLNIQGVKLMIFDSDISENKANIGGALFLNDNSEVYLVRCRIINNQASESSSIFRSQGVMSIPSLWRIEQDNEMESSIVQNPTRLTIRLNKNSSLLRTQVKFESRDERIDKVLPFYSDKEFIYLPNGQRLKDYKFYNQTDDRYYYPNYTFSIYALDGRNNIQLNISNTSCKLTPLVNGILKRSVISILDISFSEQSLNYNLEDIIFYLNPYKNEELHLYIQCSSIKIPVINFDPPFNVIGYHDNYKLLVKIKSLYCEIGEIWENELGQCQLCDASQQQYSVVANASKCQQINEESVQNLTSAQLQLRQFYWRPYRNNDQVQLCINLPSNCLGGWDVGDNSCFIGHIGALCEQCDLYNIRGSGQYAQSDQFSCGQCVSLQQNVVIIVAVSLWTLFSMRIAVQSSTQVLEGLRKLWRCPNVALLVANKDGLQAILIKSLLNYFQIVGSLNQFQLELPDTFRNIFKSLGNPIQNMVYSLDCFLIDSSNLDILYSRIIWQLSMPFIYLGTFVFIYQGFNLLNGTTQPIGHVITATIYIFIFLQPNIIGALISLISFRTISGINWVQGHVAYQYNTQTHQNSVIYLSFVLISFGVALPFYFFWQLSSLKGKLNRISIRAKFGYLYNEYKLQAYYWEIIKILLKELIIIVLIFYQDQIFLKAILIFFLLQSYVKFQDNIHPYNLKQLNSLDLLSNQICSYSMIFGFGIYMSQQSKIRETQAPFVLILAAANGFYLFNMLSQLLAVSAKKYENHIDKIKVFILTKLPKLQNHSMFCFKILAPKSEKRKQIKNKLILCISSIIRSNKLVKSESEKGQKQQQRLNDSEEIENQLHQSPGQQLDSQKEQLLLNFGFKLESAQQNLEMLTEVQKNDEKIYD